MTASATDTAASLAVSDPAAGPAGGWLVFRITRCLGETCDPVQECPRTAGGTTCALSQLAPFTAYTVKVVAASGDVLSSETSVSVNTLPS